MDSGHIKNIGPRTGHVSLCMKKADVVQDLINAFKNEDMGTTIADIIKEIRGHQNEILRSSHPFVESFLVIRGRRMEQNCLSHVTKLICVGLHVLRDKVAIIATNLLHLAARGHPTFRISHSNMSLNVDTSKEHRNFVNVLSFGLISSLVVIDPHDRITY